MPGEQVTTKLYDIASRELKPLELLQPEEDDVAEHHLAPGSITTFFKSERATVTTDVAQEYLLRVGYPNHGGGEKDVWSNGGILSVIGRSNGGTDFLYSKRGKQNTSQTPSVAPPGEGASRQVSQISAQLQALRVNRPPSEEPQSEA